jgi:acetyltransferase-like isoleucine patch superfamily enzyme
VHSTFTPSSMPAERFPIASDREETALRRTLVDIPRGGWTGRFARFPLAIRKRLLRPWHCWRFAEFGADSDIGRRCHVVNPGSIAIGSRVQIQRYANLEALDAREDRIRVRIGDGTIIRPHVHIGAVESVTIGRDCIIAPFTLITDHDHDTTDPTQPVATHRRVLAAPTVIEDGVFIAERVAVLYGVRVGKCSIVGTNSVVTRDIPPYSIAVGIPARVIKTWDPATRTWTRVRD